jgi:thioredoxin 1
LVGQLGHTANLDKLAVDEYNKGHYSQALASFKQIVKTHPNSVFCHYYMGLCYQRLNQIALARQEYNWVVQNSLDTSMKPYAQRALGQLSQYQSKRNYSGGNTSDVSAKTNVSPVSYSGGRPKILEFSATWCGPCKKFAPIFDTVKSSYQSRADFQSIDIDDERHKELVNKYSVTSVPTIVFLNGQGKVMDIHHGTMSEAGFTGRIDQLLQGK